jgi:hypothetical protein
VATGKRTPVLCLLGGGALGGQGAESNEWKHDAGKEVSHGNMCRFFVNYSSSKSCAQGQTTTGIKVQRTAPRKESRKVKGVDDEPCSAKQ